MIRGATQTPGLNQYSIGMGDRFGRQGVAQLDAVIRARERKGIHVTPVWNKSFREHSLVRTVPADARRKAAAAVSERGWKNAYYVDADHINLKNLDSFLVPCDFFTIDVAEHIGAAAVDEDDLRSFLSSGKHLASRINIKRLEHPIAIEKNEMEASARKFLPAIREAARIYRTIEQRKGKGRFIAEISLDETDQPQTPVDLLIILAATSFAGIPARTIAPRFPGRFNKGVEYCGDIDKFASEFRADMAVLQFAIQEFRLPPDLKLSIHSGSDKFALYPRIRCILREFGAGVHLKTAGTTWLEEVTGLALAGGDGLAIAKAIYAKAFANANKFCAPYAAVIDIDDRKLPTPAETASWDGERFAATLRHDEGSRFYNPDFRQLVHVSYPAAADMGERFLNTLDACRSIIAENVTANLCDRHIVPLFG